ncbi:hypothetical protein [Caulobacter sp. CCH5-E12]|uniref:hypothetical protein n=1 Tax=Caulobacter sp. CCH5-E12 TaxID=1768770 RepID=UPI0007804707|nr:hypothetical protein [Caulobacter sp. CCH5-E12]
MTSALRDMFPDVARRIDKHLPPADAYTKPTGVPGRAAAGDVIRKIEDGQDKARDLRVRAEIAPPEPRLDGRSRWSAPPAPEAALPFNVVDLTGRTFGRMTVIGYHKSKAGHGALWLARCVCGYYELRKTKAITNSIADQSCSVCTELEHFRWLTSSAGRKMETPQQLAERFDELARSQKRRLAGKK